MPEINSHTKEQRQGSQGTIFLEAVMHVRLHGLAVWEDDFQPRAARIRPAGERRAKYATLVGYADDVMVAVAAIIEELERKCN